MRSWKDFRGLSSVGSALVAWAGDRGARGQQTPSLLGLVPPGDLGDLEEAASTLNAFVSPWVQCREL